ncbi:unnamed protein product [Symbiodinium necroappetens]|uniref:Uncharacterized protein n=1 Tax=Symbiodinium necroappetens TaxID=1628268 RepID=A0A813C3P1_9DINO|nr:unnamed protein product [Symbiodinium necroappetens]
MPQDAVVQLAKHSAYDGDAVQQLRALSSEALEELLRDLWEAALSGSGSGGAWAVQAAWLGSPGRLSELATSGSHAVGVRALTALLKTDPARLLSLLGFCGDGGVVETSSLSAARRRVALRTLGRLSRTTLEGLVTPELLNKLVSVPSDCPSAARLLKGANPEIVEVWWPKLPVPCSTAISIATRLPQLTLQLIVDAPQRWKEHELHKVVSACAASAPAALGFLVQCAQQAAFKKAAAQPKLFLWILQGLSRKAPQEGLAAVARLPGLGRADLKQWGAVLRVCARRGDSWPLALEVAVKLVEDPADPAPLFRALQPEKPLSKEQLGALFSRLGLQHLGGCLKDLQPWNQDRDLEEALSALVDSMPHPPASISGLAQWTPQARRLLTQKLTEKKPPEVAGGPPDSNFLEALSWQPYADVEAEIKKRCSSSNASARQAGLCSLILCAGRDGPVAVTDTLKFFDLRLRNEQDNVRAGVLRQMVEVPVLVWQDVHIPSLRQLLTSSVQAKGTSWESLSVWRLLVEALMANGAALRTELGLGAYGTFALEVKSQLTDALLWNANDAEFGSGVLCQTARLEPQLAFLAFPWLVDFLRPSIRALLDSRRVDQACALLVQWDSQRLEFLRKLPSGGRPTVPDITNACAAFAVLLRETVATALQGIHSIHFSAAAWAQAALQSVLLPSFAHLKDSQNLTWAQEQAVRCLCQLCSSWWQTFVGRMGSALPWHTSLAVQFLGRPEARHLQRRNGALFNELVQALCGNWDSMAEWQKRQFAGVVTQQWGGACRSAETFSGVAPLLHRLCDWPDAHVVEQRSTNKRIGEVTNNIRLRERAQELVARQRSGRASLLARWRRQDASLKAELLCTSRVLLRALQHKPEAIQLLVGFESDKLQQLQRLMASWNCSGCPLHFLNEEWKGPRQFFSWPVALQRSFANVWLDPGPLGLREFQEVTIPWEVKLAQCRLRLALPALGAEELGSVLEACTETLNQEHQEDNTAVAIARGRAGWLLDRLIPVMARADRPKEVFQLISRQLGQGNSKQAARSFQHVLRRLGPIDAQNALEAALQSRLKVAERVALLRDSSELGLFNGSDANFVALLESLYESHRDVGGAVLAALCKIGQTSLLKRVSQDDRSLYQLQVMLGQLQSTSGSFLGDEVASVLAMFCQRPGLGVQSLQVLSAWAQSRRTRDAGTVAQVASASSQALASKDEGLWAPAAGCLVSLAHLDSSPLTTIFCQLSAEVANLLRASSRLRVLTQRLLHAKASSEASEALVLAVVSAGFPDAFCAGLALWLGALGHVPSLERACEGSGGITESPFFAPHPPACAALQLLHITSPAETPSTA